MYEGDPVFHALTGATPRNSFTGKGQISAWNTWSAFPEVTPALRTLSSLLELQTIDSIFPTVGRFISQLYKRTSSEEFVNAVRQYLFTRKNRQMELLFPTCDAHRIIQAGYIWAHALIRDPVLPLPGDFGWKKADSK